MSINEHEERRQFVEKMALLLKEANSYVKDCVYCTSEKEDLVTVSMKNDYQYKINVTGNSLAAIAVAVFGYMMHK